MKQYEKLGDVLGRIGSYSGLLHATDSTVDSIAEALGQVGVAA